MSDALRDGIDIVAQAVSFRKQNLGQMILLHRVQYKFL